jgi:class 3 adenylate cyclase/tetratricopeptide (TPR) repeat protein
MVGNAESTLAPRLQCKHCGFAIEATAHFCGGCGRAAALQAPVGHHALSFLQSNVPAGLSERVLRAGNSMIGERKHVTVLFADVGGSTALIDQLDPEDALEVLGPVLKLLMDAVHQQDGLVNQTRGDGIMALFGAPIASEDHAVQACRAALAMRGAIAEHNRQRDSNIAIRVGMNSGEVVVHSIGSDLMMNYDAVGKTVHLAARMEEMAGTGGVLMTQSTYDLARGFVSALPRGKAQLKGVSEPVETFELSEMQPQTRWQVRSSRGLRPIVGRDAELDAIQKALDIAASGRGQALAVVGAAGLGKSRLVHDFIASLANDWLLIETAGASQQTRSGYYPIANLIRSLFGVRPTDDHATIAHRVADGIERMDQLYAPFLPALLSLLDLNSDDREWKRLEPSERRYQVMEAIKTLTLRQAHATPLVILVEDVHWVDAESRLVLQNLVAAIGQARILLLVTQRPEAVWTDQAFTRLELSPLSEAASQQLLGPLMGDHISLVGIKRRILAQAGGNALFLEELVQALSDGAVLEGPPGQYRLGRAIEKIDMPQTVHSVLAARIDLLDARPKALLQTSAVIGKDVPLALLAGMTGIAAADLARELETLETADFLYKARATGGADYSFKHELTREVAYNTMLLGTRRELHAKAVEVIETQFADRLNEYIDRLADHAFLAALWGKAIPYQQRSCLRAVRSGANHNAISIYERAIETFAHLPPSQEKMKAEIDFRLIVILALEPLGQHRRIAEVLREARGIADGSQDAWRSAAVNCQLAVAHWRLGEHDAALAAGEAALEMANKVQDPTLIFAALHNIGMVHHETGAFTKSVEFHERCLKLETPELDRKQAGWAAFPSVVLRAFLVDSLTELGEFERADKFALEASARAEKADHAYSRANINHVLAKLRVVQGRHEEALSFLKRSWQTCLDLEMVQMYPVFASRMGDAHLAAGDVAAALEILDAPEKLDVPLAEHTFGWRFLFLTQGRALLAAGRHADAKAVGERALGLADARGEPPQRAYAMKLLGDIAASSGDNAVAAKHIATALAIAESCAMRPLAAQCRDALASVKVG